MNLDLNRGAKTLLRTSVLAFSVAVFGWQTGTALAQTATNVVCSQCVNTSDIHDFSISQNKLKGNVITTHKIIDGQVKTADLGNGAVTTGKVANSAITTVKIAEDAITASRIANDAVNTFRITDGTIASVDLSDGAVTTTKIRDNNVTTAKIAAGAVGADQLANDAVTGDKIADGAITFENLASDAVFLQTVVVSPVGPAATDNCTELQSALSNITDNSATKPYLIKIEPGIYDCGTTAVAMKDYVDIEGSGRGVTVIKGAVDSEDGLIQMAGNVELRQLSVENDVSSSVVSVGTGIGDLSTAENLRVSNVSVSFAGDSDTIWGVGFTENAEVTLTNVSILADGSGGADLAIGVAFQDATTLGFLNNVHSQATGAVSVDRGLVVNGQTVAATVRVRNSILIGSTHSARVSGPVAGTLSLVSTQLDGPTNGTMTCVGSYNGSFNTVSANCN